MIFFTFVFLVGLILEKQTSYAYTFPEYCSKVEHLNKRALQPLTKEELSLNPKLLQVQVLIRHGARTPYGRLFCWDKVKSPMDEPWSCGTMEVMSNNIHHDSNSKSNYGRLYRKQYTAGHNIFDGTCPVGALLPEGFEQLRITGRHFRDIYIGDGPTKLFNDSILNNEKLNSIYLRSDDEERTIASGMAFIDELFPVEERKVVDEEQMPIWHVADYPTDVINTNVRICPRLNFIRDQFKLSSSHIEFAMAKSTLDLEEEVRKVVGKFDWGTILECLMITRCNKMPLPKGMTEELSDRIIAHVEQSEYLKLTYMNSWYSKVSMQPLLGEILWRIEKVRNKASDASKLVLYGGHDSTLLPLVAAISGKEWDGKWTPYAGHVVFEYYEIKKNEKVSSHAVRVLYKGKPLRITGCSQDLCDFETFYQSLQFAYSSRDCSVPTTIPNTLLWSTSNSPFNSSALAILSVVGILIVGFAIKKSGVGHSVGTAIGNQWKQSRFFYQRLP